MFQPHIWVNVKLCTLEKMFQPRTLKKMFKPRTLEKKKTFLRLQSGRDLGLQDPSAWQYLKTLTRESRVLLYIKIIELGT